MRQASGFTLLELMVTLGIAAILLMAGLPSFRTFSQNLELRGAAQRLASDLDHARHSAVNRNGLTGVCSGDATAGCTGSTAWDDGWIVFEDANGNRDFDPGETVLTVAPGFRRVAARSSAARTRLMFYPNGTAPGSNATVWLCDERGSAHGYQLRVSLTGRVRTTTAMRDGDAGC